MTTQFQPHFKSILPQFSRDKMFEQMRNVIKYQEHFRRRVSNWEHIPPSSLNIDLENITRLFYLNDYEDSDDECEMFRMIARMTTVDGLRIYVDVTADMFCTEEHYKQWCKDRGLKVEFPGKGEIFYCTDPAIFMSLALGRICWSKYYEDSIFSLLYEDGIDIKKDYQKYKESLTNSDTRREFPPETLFKLCENYYRDNAKFYARTKALVIPKLEIENIGIINRFAESVAVYNVDRPISNLVDIQF